MKKITIFITLIFITINLYKCNPDDFDERWQQYPAAKKIFLNQWEEWINNPDKMLADVLPLCILTKDSIVYKNDTFYITTDTCQYCYENYTAMKSLYDTLYDYIILNKDNFYGRVYENELYRSYLLADISRNIWYSFVIYSPFIILTHKVGKVNNIKMAERPLLNYTIMGGSGKIFSKITKRNAIKTLLIDNSPIFLTKGNRKYGLDHIMTFHTPKGFRDRGIFKNAQKSLFITSEKKYILKMLDKFQRNKNGISIYEIKPDKIVFQNKLKCETGIERNYFLVVDRKTNVIITFYPEKVIPNIDELSDYYIHYKNLKR